MHRRRTKSVRLALLGAGLALLVGLTGPASVRSQPKGQAPADKPMGFLRCPECGLEFASEERQILCPRCGQKKVPMVFSTTQGSGLPSDPSFSWRFPGIVGGVVLFLAAALYLLGGRKKAGDRLRAAGERERLRTDAERERVVKQQDVYDFMAAQKRKRKR